MLSFNFHDIQMGQLSTRISASRLSIENFLRQHATAEVDIIVDGFLISVGRVSIWLVYSELLWTFSRILLLGEDRYIHFDDQAVMSARPDYDTCSVSICVVGLDREVIITFEELSNVFRICKECLKDVFSNVEQFLIDSFDSHPDSRLFDLLSAMGTRGFR